MSVQNEIKKLTLYTSITVRFEVDFPKLPTFPYRLNSLIFHHLIAVGFILYTIFCIFFFFQKLFTNHTTTQFSMVATPNCHYHCDVARVGQPSRPPVDSTIPHHFAVHYCRNATNPLCRP